MLKFFRRIRQTLLSENKFSKYLLYAIGEIVLVVIGILIALQINNWNEEKLKTKKEKFLLGELHQEFIKNKNQLEDVVKNHQRALKSAQYALSEFPLNPKETNMVEFFTNTMDLGRTYTFNPSQGVVKSLINSSDFEIIRDNHLRQLLISWEDVLKDYQEEEIIAKQSFNDIYLPKIFGKISFKNLADPRNDLSYFSSLEYENIVQARAINLLDILESEAGELEKIKWTIDQILERSEPKK